MGKFFANKNQVCWAYESGTYATAGSPAQSFGLVQTHTLSEEENIQQMRYMGTEARTVDKFLPLAEDIRGTVTYYPQDWRMLAFALGSNVDAWAGSPTEPKTHTMTAVTSTTYGSYLTAAGSNVFNSFSIEDAKQFNPTGLDFIRTVTGAVIDTFKISASMGEIVTCTVDYIAKDTTFTSGTVAAHTPATTTPYLWADVILSIPSGTAQEELKTMEFTVNNNINANHYMQAGAGRTISTPFPGNADYLLTATLDADSTYAKALYDTYYKTGAAFNSMLLIQANSGSKTITISMSGCWMTDMTIPSENEGLNEYTLTIVPELVSAIASDTTELYNSW